jgi:hypothetical protein
MKLPLCTALWMVLLLLAAGPGCQTTPKVEIESDKKAEFARYRTFHLMELPQRIPGGDPGLMLRLRDTIEETVRATLTGKGYTEAAQDQTDLAVLVRGEIIPKVEVHDLGYSSAPFWGYRRHGYRYVYGTTYPGAEVDTYSEGLLAVEVFDNRTKRQVWVGWTQNRTTRKSVEPARVAEALREILMRYPDVTP